MNFKKVKPRFAIATMCFLLVATTSFSQKSKTGNWFIYFGNQKINKKWNWWNEVQLRNYNLIGDVQQLLLRTGIGYDLEENKINLLMGYAHVTSYNYSIDNGDKMMSTENRIYQQLTLKNRYGRFYLTHRYRAEERFINSDFKFRFRYFLSCNVPFTKAEMTTNAFYASLYNEIFLISDAPFFDRNRAYAALGYVINSDLKLELGYMKQTLEKTSRNQFQIVFLNNLSLKKE